MRCSYALCPCSARSRRRHSPWAATSRLSKTWVGRSQRRRSLTAVRQNGRGRSLLPHKAPPVTAADSAPAPPPVPSSPQRRRSSRVRCCALRQATCECRCRHRPPRRSRRRSCCRRRRCVALEAHSRPGGRPCRMPSLGRPPRLLLGRRPSREHPSPAGRPRLSLGQAAQVLIPHLRLLAAPRRSG